MKTLKRALTWLELLQLRLLKRPVFWLLLLLPPLLSLALAAAARGEKGVVTAAVYPGGDGFAMELTERLEAEGGLLRYEVCPSPEAAEDLVTSGRADAAWIFPAQAGAALEDYAAGRRGEPIRVVEREESVLLRLARERLYTELVPALAERSFRLSLERESGAAVSPAEAKAALAGGPAGRELVSVSYGGATDQGAPDYLLSPVRGLLALLVLLGGLAAGLLLLGDRAAGRLTWTSRGGRFAVTAAELILPMLDLSVSTFASLCLAGLNTGAGYEALLLLLLTLSGSGLALVLCSVLGTPWRVAAVLPLLALAVLAFCPVLLDLSWARPLSLLLPPYHYLLAVRQPVYALYLALYAAVAWAAGAALRFWRA